MVIGLQQQDAHIIESLASTIGYTGPLHYTENRVQLAVSSRALGEALIKHGCIPRKSLKLQFPPHLPDWLFWHFLRESVADRLTEHHVTITKTNRVYLLSMSGNQQIKGFLELLYKEATYYLRRKAQKRDDFLSLLETVRPIRLVKESFDETAIVNAYLTGMKITDIEDRFQITNRTVYKFLRKHRVQLRTRNADKTRIRAN